jgi:hypothetical protein
MHFVKDFTISDTSKIKNIHSEDRLADRHLVRLPGSVAKLVSLSVDATVTAGQARSPRDCMSQSWGFDNQSALTKDGQRQDWQRRRTLVQMPADRDVSS